MHNLGGRRLKGTVGVVNSSLEAYRKSGKSKSVAVLLALLLPVGSARIYLGYYTFGVIQMIVGIIGAIIIIENPMITGREHILIFALGGIVAIIIGIIDLIRILMNNLLPSYKLQELPISAQTIVRKSESESALEMIEKLANLRDQGILSEDEFLIKKENLLKKI